MRKFDEEFLAVFRALVARRDQTQWELGDAANEQCPIGERGKSSGRLDQMRELAHQGRIEFEALRQYAAVSSAWPNGTRVPSASWSAHRLLMTEKYRHLLQPNMGYKEAQDAIKALAPPPIPPAPEPLPAPQVERAPIAPRDEEARHARAATILEIKAFRERDPNASNARVGVEFKLAPRSRTLRRMVENSQLPEEIIDAYANGDLPERGMELLAEDGKDLPQDRKVALAVKMGNGKFPLQGEMEEVRDRLRQLFGGKLEWKAVEAFFNDPVVSYGQMLESHTIEKTNRREANRAAKQAKENRLDVVDPFLIPSKAVSQLEKMSAQLDTVSDLDNVDARLKLSAATRERIYSLLMEISEKARDKAFEINPPAATGGSPLPAFRVIEHEA